MNVKTIKFPAAYIEAKSRGYTIALGEASGCVLPFPSHKCDVLLILFIKGI
jgi:hypothetical protein